MLADSFFIFHIATGSYWEWSLQWEWALQMVSEKMLSGKNWDDYTWPLTLFLS